jgi:hypothetical protein
MGKKKFDCFNWFRWLDWLNRLQLTLSKCWGQCWGHNVGVKSCSLFIGSLGDASNVNWQLKVHGSRCREMNESA